MKAKCFFTNHIFISFFIIFALACKVPSEKDSKKRAEEINKAKFNKTEEKDAQYLVDIYSSGLFEIKIAEEAKNGATTKEVEDLAQLLDTAHQQINSQIKKIAMDKQVNLPNTLTPTQNYEMQSLTRKNGLDFDKSFIDLMIFEHKESINNYKKIASESLDSTIRKWAANNLVQVHKHLTTANKIKEKINTQKQ